MCRWRFAVTAALALAAASCQAPTDPVEGDSAQTSQQLEVRWQPELVPADGSDLGPPLALSGERVLIAPQHAFAFDSLSWNEQIGIADPLALSGDTALSAGCSGDLAGVQQPAQCATIWSAQRQGWRERAVLRPDTDEAIGFAAAGALDGDVAAVGAPNCEVDTVPNAGCVYLFERVRSRWIHRGKLVASDPIDDRRFGKMLALSGDNLIVGADWSAYLFERHGDTFRSRGKLPMAWGAMLTDVAISGDTALLGAYPPQGELSSWLVGYVYQRSGAGWHLQTVLPLYITASIEGPQVALSGDIAIVDNTIFTRCGSLWSWHPPIHPDAYLMDHYRLNDVALDGITGVMSYRRPDAPDWPGRVFAFALGDIEPCVGTSLAGLPNEPIACVAGGCDAPTGENPTTPSDDGLPAAGESPAVDDGGCRTAPGGDGDWLALAALALAAVRLGARRRS